MLRSLLINCQLTGEFETEAGVPQGAVLSPHSAIYINGLHKALSDAGLGVWVQVAVFLCCFMASSEVELQAMLDLVFLYVANISRVAD